MRTGNAFWSLTIEAPPEPVCRLTLLDAGDAEAVAELIVEALPWEESAAVPVEAMSAFREAMESVPETWASAVCAAPRLTLAGSFEVEGVTRAFLVAYASPEGLTASLARFLSAIAAAAGAALVGGRSRRMLRLLEEWSANAAS